MDWLGKFLDLPKEYLNCSEGPGGGVIQGNIFTIYSTNFILISNFSI